MTTANYLNSLSSFLVIGPPHGIRLMATDAKHQARWMAMILYSIKVWMFRKQFLTAREEKSLRNTSMFASLAYTEACISCPNSAFASLS